MTGIGDILSGGFGVIRQRPAAVLIWAAIYAGIGLLSMILVLPMAKGMIHQMMTMTANPEANPFAAMQGMQSFQGAMWLLSFVSYFVGSVVLCGAFRTLLRPDEPGFASLRLGWDEMRVFGIIVVLSIGAPFVLAIFFLIVMLLGLVLGFALQSVPALQYLLIALLVIAAIGAALYVWVRISLMLPLTFLRRRLVIDEAWTATRGRFWTLFGPYLIVFLIITAVSMVVMTPVMMWFLSQLGDLPHGGEDPEALRQAMAALMDRLFDQPLGLLGGFVIVSALLKAVSTALYGGVMAAAAHGFLADDGKLPEEDVFA